jgi:ATP-binding protein involved in chromosome partitioning
MPKPPIPTEIAENMKGIKHKIVVLSGKGGVGKTTVATNLAVSFARRGKTAGIVDVDIYGPNVPKLLGLEGQHPTVDGEFILPIVGPEDVKVMSMGFLLRKDDDAVAWRGPLVARAITQFLANVRWGELDVLIVDLPPGTGDEILSILQSIPDIDGVVIVSTPQEVAVLDARRAIQLVEKMDVPVLGIVENMSEFLCPKCGESYKIFGEGAVKKASEEFGVDHLGALPLDPRVVSLSDEGSPFVIKEPESKVAKAFSELVDKLTEKTKMN